MNPDDLARLLDDLTERFGPAAVRLFELATRQATVEGLASLIAGLVLMIVPLALWAVGSRWYWKRETANKDPKGAYVWQRPESWPVVFSGAIPLIGVLCGGGLLYNGFLWLANPEWAAIQILGRLLP